MPIYEVWSTYKVTGTAYVEAECAKEAIEKGLSGEVKFDFSDAHSETKMRARRVRATKPTEYEETP